MRDLQAGTTRLVSVNNLVEDSGNGLSFEPAISADGRFIAFSSRANNLTAAPDTNAGQPFPDSQTDVFVRDLQTETTTLISINQVGSDTGNNGSGSPRISADGRIVAFVSSASDLVAIDTSSGPDLFVRPVHP